MQLAGYHPPQHTMRIPGPVRFRPKDVEATMRLSTILRRLDACAEARAWAKTQPDLQTAWTNCQRSDWMLWLLSRTGVDRDDPRLRLMACDFAEAVLYLVPPNEDRPKQAIAIARKFAIGEATREELSAASDAAWAAGAAAGATAGVAAWNAARDAAWAARDAAWAARDAAWAAWAAGAAAGDVAWNAARNAQSNIIRIYFPECPVIDSERLKKVRLLS